MTLDIAVLAIKATEDVLGVESGPIDKTILVFIHDHFPTAWTAALKVITLSGAVLAAACIGATIPLVPSLALTFRHAGSDRSSY